jgi:lipoprotein-anchoring transpeptidase ErfK/SrfK
MIRPTQPASFESTNSRCSKFTLLSAAFLLSATAAVAQTPSQTQIRPATQTVRRIVVSIPDRKLALLEADRIVKIYNIAVGAPVSPSPSGEFEIVQRLENPTYFHPGVVIGPGANNPLGPRWIGLNVKGFGIHGTNRPDSIGKNASHGCIRLSNRDIEDLFTRVRVGDPVSLIAERTDEVARLFGPAPSLLAEAQESLQAKNDSPAAQNKELRGQR